jgi:hypothetical protein
MKSGNIHFDGIQLQYLMMKTGEDEPAKAVEVFMVALRFHQIDPFQAHVYLKRLMQMDGICTS